MSKHARLSPSNHRWVYCPGSIREEAVYPDISGAAAIDGTGSHLLLELCLNNNRLPQSYLGEIVGANHEDKPGGWLVNQDRIDRVSICTDYVERRMKELNTNTNRVAIITESKSNPGELVNRVDWWGTVDITLIVYDGLDIQLQCPILFVEVIDYKDGRNFVDVKNNPQLLAYLAGTTMLKSIDSRMTIIQPKTNRPIRYRNSNSEELCYNFADLAYSAKATDNPNASLIPDDKNGRGYCLWCKHKGNCKALNDKKLEVFDVLKNHNSAFESIAEMFKDMNKTTGSELSQLLDTKPIIDDLFKRAQEEAESRLNQGIGIPGYAMHPGKSKKEWDIKEEDLVRKLRACKLKKEEIYISNLISPAQVLKHPSLTEKQKTRFENNYIVMIPGNRKITPISREAKDPVDIFKDIDVQCTTDKVSFI